jgi:hypothetical protein
LCERLRRCSGGRTSRVDRILASVLSRLSRTNQWEQPCGLFRAQPDAAGRNSRRNARLPHTLLPAQLAHLRRGHCHRIGCHLDHLRNFRAKVVHRQGRLTAIALGRTSTENCYETVAQEFVHHAAVFTRREAKGQIGVNFAASPGITSESFPPAQYLEIPPSLRPAAAGLWRRGAAPVGITKEVIESSPIT